MPTNTDPAAVTDMARRREATTFHGDEAQFWVFDLADGGRVHIPPDQVRRLWNAEQLQQQLKGCECPARKALQRMMDEHGHDCDCIPRVLCEYCEGRAALSAPCPCEHFVWSDDPAIDRRVIARLRSERDSLRAELAAEKERSANLEMARDIAQERADRIEAASWNALKLAQSLHDLSLKSGADLAASQERERLLREALQPFASAVMQTRDMIAKMEALGRTCDWKLPMRVTEADWERAAAVATPEGTVRP